MIRVAWERRGDTVAAKAGAEEGSDEVSFSQMIETFIVEEVGPIIKALRVAKGFTG